MAIDDRDLLAKQLEKFRSMQPSMEDALGAPEASTGASAPAPIPEPPQDDLASAQQRRSDMMRNIALIQAANQIGQSIAGGETGKFGVDPNATLPLRKMAESQYQDVLTRRKETEKKKKEQGEKEAAGLYRDLLKQQIPDLEVSEEVPASHLKGLLSNFKKASIAFQQSQYMTTAGDPVTFDPGSNRYINALSGKPVGSGEVIRNYVKTITDPKTGEIKEVRPGVGVVKTIAGAPQRSPRSVSESDMKDYTYDMLNPKQRDYLKEAEKNYAADVKDSREFGEVIANVDDLIESDVSAAIPAIKRQLARSVGKEVGVMTDADVAAFSGDQSFLGAMQRFAKLQATGRMTEKDKDQFREIISIARKNLDKAIDNRAGFHVSRLKTRLPDATPQSLRSLLSVQASKPMGVVNTKQMEAAQKWLEENPDHPKAEAVRQKIQRMMGQ